MGRGAQAGVAPQVGVGVELQGRRGLAAAGGVGGVRRAPIGRGGPEQSCGRHTPAAPGGVAGREERSEFAWVRGCYGWGTEFGGKMTQSRITEA